MLGQEGGLPLSRFPGGLVGGQELVGIHQLVLRQVGVSGIGDVHLFGAPLGLAQADIGEVVRAQDHILGGHGNRLAVLGTEQVVG